ncbi:MAG: peptidylprolyl isomerase [Myxococcales bacterium]|nr:peptidylprolyl isomerase [Myxococcales bacterium]
MLRACLAATLLSVLVLPACGSSGSGGGASSGGTGGATGGGGGSGGTAATGGMTGGSAGVATGGGGTGDAGGAGGKPVIEMDTSLGKMVFELEPTDMPVTTANFLSYVDSGFYDGTIIHRVLPDFVIQGGGYATGLVAKTANPPIKLETSPAVQHDYGVISMARTSDPDSADSQFFVVNAKAGSHSLDGSYAAFGRMLEGGAVLDAISGVPTQSQSGLEDVPVTEIVVKSVTRKP